MALKSLVKLLTMGSKRLWIGVEEVKLRNKLKIEYYVQTQSSYRIPIYLPSHNTSTKYLKFKTDAQREKVSKPGTVLPFNQLKQSRLDPRNKCSCAQ
jgi:hypothetical protein